MFVLLAEIAAVGSPDETSKPKEGIERNKTVKIKK
jgi:hypothetical protein